MKGTKSQGSRLISPTASTQEVREEELSQQETKNTKGNTDTSRFPGHCPFTLEWLIPSRSKTKSKLIQSLVTLQYKLDPIHVYLFLSNNWTKGQLLTISNTVSTSIQISPLGSPPTRPS